jgi:hypothetical protein
MKVTELQGQLPKRIDSLSAEVLRMLLQGQALAGLDAVYSASTTRLAAVTHYLSSRYGWPIFTRDKVVGCRDGRVSTVTEYHLLASTIELAMRSGAEAWCKSVAEARARLRQRAPQAKEMAARLNALASKRQVHASEEAAT